MTSEMAKRGARRDGKMPRDGLDQ